MRLRALAALLVVAASCRSTRPSPSPPPPHPPSERVEDGASNDGGTGVEPYLHRVDRPDAGPLIQTATDGGASEPLTQIDAAFARGDTEQAIAACENEALTATAPAALLLRAARARKQRVAAALADPDGAGKLPSVARDAEACAADARRAWSAEYPIAGAQVDGTHPAAEVYGLVGLAGAEALYLEAVCSAGWARTQGFTQLVERRLELIEELRRALQLAPALDSAGPDRELGALFCALPSYAGGDLTLARHHFEAATARAPDAAANHLEFARTVAVKAQDRELFETQLKLAAVGADPAAAAQAAGLLAREEDLFGPAEAAQPTPGGPQK